MLGYQSEGIPAGLRRQAECVENTGEKALPRGQGIDTIEGSWAGALLPC